MGVRIRRVETTDGSLLKLTRLRSLATDPLSFAAALETEAAYDDSVWSDWAADDASGDEMATFLALKGDDSVGIVAAYQDESESATFHVIAMWVAPEARREGIGARLLETVEEWIATVGGDCVQLSVTDRAKAACQLYESAGYRPDGSVSDSPHTAGMTHVSLRKPLSPPS